MIDTREMVTYQPWGGGSIMVAGDCSEHGFSCYVNVSPDVREQAAQGLSVPSLLRVPFGMRTFVSPEFAYEHRFMGRLEIPYDQEAMWSSHLFDDPSLGIPKWWDAMTVMCEDCLRDAYEGDLEAEFDCPPRKP